MLKLVKEFMESTMQEELSLYIGKEQYERTDTDSLPCRNGYCQRSFVTQFGPIPDVKCRY
ncbi:MAG: transposase [Candidatus Omnitrophota bacterium]